MVKLGVLFVVMWIGLSTFAATCPSPIEAKSQMELYQLKSINMASNSNVSTADAEKLMKEFEDYYKNMFFGCMSYFESSTPYHDCDKFVTLQTGFLMLDKTKQQANKASVDNLYDRYKDKCPAAYQTYKLIVK